jgi:tetratricopeptide (TPR) repeat protein
MSSIIDKAFTDAYNECAELYDNDELEKCIEKAQALLDYGAAPRYHRMKTWILLGNCLGDWDEAHDSYVEAETMWRIVRRWHRAGEDAKVDAAMEELRVSLEELKETLAKDKPAYDDDEEVANRMAEHDAAVQEQKNIDRAAEELEEAEKGIVEAEEELKETEEVFSS